MQLEVLQPGRVQRRQDLQPRVRRDVRVVAAEDDHQPAGDPGRLGQGARVVGAQGAVLQAGRVEAHGGRDPRVERGAERQVSAQAEAHRVDLVEVVALLEVVEDRYAVGVELGGRRGGGRASPACFPGSSNSSATPASSRGVDLRQADQEPGRGQLTRGPQRRLGELEDVGVVEDAATGRRTDRLDHDRLDVAVRGRDLDPLLAQLHRAHTNGRSAAAQTPERATTAGRQVRPGDRDGSAPDLGQRAPPLRDGLHPPRHPGLGESAHHLAVGLAPVARGLDAVRDVERPISARNCRM